MLDELAAGVPTGGAPQIQQTFGLSYAGAQLVIFVVPGVVALFVEPVIFLLADRYPRQWFVRGGLAGMACASLLAALAPGPITLACVFSLWFVATGSAAAIAQATLIDRDPEQRARTMARWTFLGLLGDFGGPLLLGTLGGDWRTSFVIVAATLAVWTVLASLTRFPSAPRVADEDEGGEPVSLLSGFRDALGDRMLLLWLFGTALCDLLDEILVVFASLHVRDDLGASVAWQSATIIAFLVGGGLGLLALDRLLTRHTERRLLVACGLSCAACYVLWLAAPTPLLAVIGIVPVGATAAPLYPLAAAQAYAQRPGRSGVILAASHLFTPLGLALPWLLGVVADHAGMLVALALLVVEPLGLALLATRSASDRDRAPP